MSTAILQKAGLKLFADHMKQYEPSDPVYEEYVDKKGRKKQRRRELPLGLSPRDQKILKKVQKRARRLDRGISLCGFRFGYTFLIGLIPFVGDFADIGLNYFLVVRKAKQAEIPDWLLRRMLFNNAISGAVGFIPFVGDIGIAVIKANSRNAALLEEFLRIRGAEFLKEQAAGPQARREDPAMVKPGAGGILSGKGKGRENENK